MNYHDHKENSKSFREYDEDYLRSSYSKHHYLRIKYLTNR